MIEYVWELKTRDKVPSIAISYNIQQTCGDLSNWSECHTAEVLLQFSHLFILLHWGLFLPLTTQGFSSTSIGFEANGTGRCSREGRNRTLSGGRTFTDGVMTRFP